MTSAATIAAAIPPALALGPGAEVRVPMAIAVIGGVLVSTLLTLFAVPSAYSLFAKLERQKYVKPEEEGEGPAPPNPPPEPEEPETKEKDR
jgi:HAE1 family hydrophobic/amphiphilic exporter-1